MGGGLNVTLCLVWSGRLRGSERDGGKDEEQVGDAVAIKKDSAGPGSTSTDILGKFVICSKDL